MLCNWQLAETSNTGLIATLQAALGAVRNALPLFDIGAYQQAAQIIDGVPAARTLLWRRNAG